MDAGDRPTPPDDLDEELRVFLAALGDEDVETIRSVAAYVDDLASWTDQQAGHGQDGAAAADAASGTADGSPTSKTDTTDVPVPEDVPDEATVSVTEIAGTEYYYYQWRDGDKIRSKTVER